VRAVAVAAMTLSVDASATPPAAPDAASAKAEAVVHFERGIALYDQGAWAAALAEFLAARRLYPLRNAVYRSGLCLEKLQQYDEALLEFESVLRDYGETLPAGDREIVAMKIREMLGVVGEVTVSGAEPGASVSVDGLPRGQYPLLVPLRVAAGSHIVRISKTGFETFEARILVAGAQIEHVAAHLQPLGPSGRVRIAEQSGKTLDVLIDGSRMGESPWEGPLLPGSHVVVLHGEGKVGTPPVQVNVEVDRTTPLTLAAEELDAALRVEPVPANASVAIDGVTVGRGIWDGRLGAGAHKVEIAAPGFFAEARRLGLAPDRKEVLRVTLDRDESSPFWRKPPRRSRFLVEATAAAVLVPTFGGDVAGCGSPCRAPLGAGGSIVLQGGYELGAGLGFGITAGYLAAAQHVSARSTTVDTTLGPSSIPGFVDDQLALRGALVGAWAGYTLGERVPLHFRLGAGALVGDLLDERAKGSFPTSHETLRPAPLGARFTASFLCVTPEVRVGWAIGRHVVLQAGVAVPVLIGLRVPRWDRTQSFRTGSGVAGQFAPNPPDALAGRVVPAIDPGLGARYDF
jgi:hypothetical protein